jgi:hypothetical protein
LLSLEDLIEIFDGFSFLLDIWGGDKDLDNELCCGKKGFWSFGF